MDARVGIITRTKDRPALLKRALESIVNQSFDDWIMVVVNDGGDPETVDMLVDAFVARAKGKILVLHNPVSLGMEAASNRGIASVRTEYLAIHDDDDSWAPEFLTITVPELDLARKKFPRVAAVIAKANAIFERMDGNTIKIESVEPYRSWMREGFISLDSMLIENQFAPIQMVFSYDAAKEVGFFREDLLVLGDWDFNIRFMARYDIYVIPQVLAFYHHRIADQSVYGNSIIASRSRHESYNQMLRNEWLRKDLATASVGVGSFGTLRLAVERLHWTNNDFRNALHHLQSTVDDLMNRLVHASNRIDEIHDRLIVQTRVRWPVKNSFLLVYIWLSSGGPFHYVAQTFRWIKAYILRATVAKVNHWTTIKEEKARRGASED